MDPRQFVAYAFASVSVRFASYAIIASAEGHPLRAHWVLSWSPMLALALSQGLALTLFLLMRKRGGWVGLCAASFCVALVFRFNAIRPYLHLQEARLSFLIDILVWLSIAIISSLAFFAAGRKDVSPKRAV